MTASLSGVYNVQEFTDLGAPLVGGRLYTYAPSTTTLKVAYTDAAGSVPHTYTNDGLGGQYIALDVRGELPAPLFLSSGGYDLALKTAAGATVWTRRAVGTDDASASVLADLASTASGEGAGIPGFDWAAIPAAVNKADWGIQTARNGYNLLRLIPPAQWAAIQAGTSTHDIGQYVLAAHAAGQAHIYIPDMGGAYYWDTARTLTWSGAPLWISGDGATDSVVKGTMIRQANAGAGLTYAGAGTLTSFKMTGMGWKYVGSDAQAWALRISNSFINTVEHCVFEGYAHKGAANDRSAGLTVTALAGQASLLTTIRHNDFVGCCDGVYADKADTNTLYIEHNRFKSCSGYGVRGGDFAAAGFAFLNWTIRWNDFEGNADGDIYITGGARGLSIAENYFEFSAVRPPIILSTNVNTPIHNSIAVRENTFVGDPGNGRGMVEAQYVDDLEFDGNVAANNLGTTRYGVKWLAGTWNNIHVKRMSTPSGQTAPATILDETSTIRTTDEYWSGRASKSWTPTIAFGGASVGVVYTAQHGEYMDDGEWVIASFRLALSSKGSSTGTLTIEGLPIPNSSNGNACFVGAGAFGSFSGFTGLTGAVSPGMATAGATSFRVYLQDATQTTSLDNTSVTNSLVINGWIRYRK